MLRFKDVKTAKKFWIVVILLMVAAGSFLIAYPLVSKANAAAENIVAAEETKAAAQKKVNDYQSYRDNYNLYEEADQTVSTKFPSKMNTVEYTAFVQRAAREAGMKSSQITELTIGAPAVTAAAAPAAAPAEAPSTDPAAAPTEGEPAPAEAPAAAPVISAGNIAESSVHISATGTMSQLNNFTTSLMGGVRDFTLTTYNVSGGESGELTASIDGKALYYRDLAKPVGETPAPSTDTATTPTTEGE